jgi:hypothetical protein
MKKKKQPWYGFRLIIPSLVIVPPLGLILLWKSPRTLRIKALVSVLLLVFLTSAFAGAVKTGLHGRLFPPKPTEEMYDVRIDSRNNYVSDEVLPFERKIFAAVVRNMRSDQGNEGVDVQTDIVDIESVGAGTRAFRAVGDEYGLDYEDVQKIYRKVSYTLAKEMK